jgi:mycothiol-dependent nitroreductase-like protein
MTDSDIRFTSTRPPATRRGILRGLRLLRVAARARAEHGRAAVGAFYEAVSSQVFDAPGAAELTPVTRGSRAFVEPLLTQAGLPAGLAGALDDPRWDEEIRAEGEEALALTGRDAGTPIITSARRTARRFSGPVISRLPGLEDAIRLWDHVTALGPRPAREPAHMRMVIVSWRRSGKARGPRWRHGHPGVGRSALPAGRLGLRVPVAVTEKARGFTDVGRVARRG